MRCLFELHRAFNAQLVRRKRHAISLYRPTDAQDGDDVPLICLRPENSDAVDNLRYGAHDWLWVRACRNDRDIARGQEKL